MCNNSTAINCEVNHNHESCGTVDNAKFQNYGCKIKLYAETSDFFYCANRKDKSDILFGHPPVPAKKAYQARNYNVELTFDSEIVYCQTHNFSYEEFGQVAVDNLQDQCHLKNGSIPLIELLFDLMTDFTFKYSSKITQY